MEDLYLTASPEVYASGQHAINHCGSRRTYHHHTTTNGIKRVRGDTSTSGNTPTEGERGQEVALEITGKESRLKRVVHTEVQTTVNDDSEDGRPETTVQTRDTVGRKGLLVYIYQAVELALATLLGRLGVVGKTGTGVIEGVDEQERSGTGSSTGGKITSHPLGVAVTLLLVAEHQLELVTEGKVEGLGREVTDDVGGVTTPQGNGT